MEIALIAIIWQMVHKFVEKLFVSRKYNKLTILIRLSVLMNHDNWKEFQLINTISFRGHTHFDVKFILLDLMDFSDVVLHILRILIRDLRALSQ
jgi:hypothetical protein